MAGTHQIPNEGADRRGSGALPRSRPPAEGHPLSAGLKRRQHEVQVVPGPGGCLAAAWTDDTSLTGIHGWTCGCAVSLDGGRSWSTPAFHKRPEFTVTGNPTVGVDARGTVFVVAMSAREDYSGGILEISHSADAGRTWSPWTAIVSKLDGIPDRPKLAVAANGDLHVVFSGIEHTGRSLKMLRGTIQVIRSTDRGRTWSEPRTISAGEHRSWWFVDGYQGPAIRAAPDGALLVSWAAYYGNRIYVSASRDGGAEFAAPVSIRAQAVAGTGVASGLLGVTIGTPSTELAIDAGGRNIVISVHEAHAMSRILLVGSRDGGRSWSRRAMLTRHGTNAALAFDPAGRLHAIWTDLRGRHLDVLHAVSADFGSSFSRPVSLAGNGARVALPRSSRDREECTDALGSYQSLVIGEDGAACAAWVDLRDGLTLPRLYRSIWQV